MTTQVLMSSSALLSDPVTISDQQPVETAQSSESSTAVAVQARKLPYQTSHQVELMHLQAETEALLQRLKTLKQQRLSEFALESNLESEASQPKEPTLVAPR